MHFAEYSHLRPREIPLPPLIERLKNSAEIALVTVYGLLASQ
jgi:hypothetical protein